MTARRDRTAGTQHGQEAFCVYSSPWQRLRYCLLGRRALPKEITTALTRQRERA